MIFIDLKYIWKYLNILSERIFADYSNCHLLINHFVKMNIGENLSIDQISNWNIGNIFISYQIYHKSMEYFNEFYWNLNISIT